MIIPRPAFAWGCAGHQVVALIGLDQLNSHARQAASDLLGSAPIDPALRRFCPPSGLPPFAELSTWADDIRSQRKETGAWHFIDIPLQAKRSAENDACRAATGCVTAAIHHQLDVLRSSSAAKQEQAEALMFLIHFVGDLHQPLHAADNDDRGGNCVAVAIFDKQPETSGASQSYRPNLHGVWDTDLVQAVAHGRDAADLAKDLRGEFAHDIRRWSRSHADIEAWAWESHKVAIKTVYGKLPHKVPVEPPHPVESCADRDMGKRMFELHEVIGQQYLEAASPVIQRQLALAGTRLAVLLNQVWP